MRTHVDLFSGIGGFALAASWAGVETIAFAEIDNYASRVLQQHWPDVRNYGRVQDVPALSAWLVTGGVPCQPASVAGKRRGASDDRWLWPEALAAVERGQYEWVLFENPTGILSLNDGVEFERICLALEGQGYEVQPLVIPACGVGAPHRRNRVWIIAHSSDRGQRELLQSERLTERDHASDTRRDGEVWIMAHADNQGLQRWERGELRECANQQFAGPRGAFMADTGKSERWRAARTGRRIGEYGETQSNGRRRNGAANGIWLPEPDVGRVANGIPRRVDRLRCLGNAIVPQVAYQLIKRMIEAEQ